MIKLKTKIIKENTKEEYIGVEFRTKDTNYYEYLVAINHLIIQLLKTNDISKEKLIGILANYIDEVK